jgi:hypothetical protein
VVNSSHILPYLAFQNRTSINFEPSCINESDEDYFNVSTAFFVASSGALALAALVALVALVASLEDFGTLPLTFSEILYLISYFFRFQALLLIV